MSIEDRARYAEALQLVARHGMVSITREQYTAIEPFLEHPSWTLDGKWLTREQVEELIAMSHDIDGFTYKGNSDLLPARLDELFGESEVNE